VGGGEGRNEVGSRGVPPDPMAMAWWGASSPPTLFVKQSAAPKPGKPSDARAPAVGDSNSSGSGSSSSSSSSKGS